MLFRKNKPKEPKGPEIKRTVPVGDSGPIKKTIEEKIPKDIAEDVAKLFKQKNEMYQNFLQTSVHVVKAQTQQKELLDKIDSMDLQLRNKIDLAYKKMKLNQRKNVQWRFNGVDGFIGMERPPQRPVTPAPKKEEKPNE